ncbi:MAG: MFS transporter [Desulfomonilaceae bacterium]
MPSNACVDKDFPNFGQNGLNLPQRMERLPLTNYQRMIFLIIATAWLFDSMDLAMMTFLLAPISKSFSLTPGQTGLLGSASLAGMAFGAVLAGIFADRFGRKMVFQTSMIIWGLAAILCSISWNYDSLLVFRFILGFGMGAEFPIAQSMVSEIIPAPCRGKYIALLEGFWPLGFILAGVVSFLLVPVGGWRPVFLVTGLPAIYVLVIRRKVPESPRWYESRGFLQDAEKTIQHIEAQVEKAYGKPLPEPAQCGFSDEIAKGGFSLWELFSNQYRIRTLMIWTLWFFALLGYYGITTWMGKLLVDKGFTITKSIEFVLLMSLWGVPGFFSAAYLIEKLGRKATVAGFVILSGAAAYFYGQAGSQNQVIIAGAFMQFFFFGMWSVIYAYTPELFPTRARATACGSASTLGRIGALLGPVIVPVIIAHYGMEYVFSLGALAFVIAAANVLILGPETKGKVLEEINQ